MSISEQTVWAEIWPMVEKLIEATLAEESETIAQLLLPESQAAEMLSLFGNQVFDILLKTVLGRPALGLTRAVEADNGTAVYIEYAWPDPEARDNSYTPTDVVTVRLVQNNDRWQIAEVNPASIDVPLTTARARQFLASTQELTENKQIPAEPWILPFALYAGVLQIPLADTAVSDNIEAQLLNGLKKRTFGIMPIMYGRRLWRTFKTTANPDTTNPAAWAAAIEFIIHEQQKRPVTQAAVGKPYKTNLSALVPRIKQIKKTLGIKGIDGRFSDIPFEQVIVDNNQTQ